MDYAVLARASWVFWGLVGWTSSQSLGTHTFIKDSVTSRPERVTLRPSAKLREGARLTEEAAEKLAVELEPYLLFRPVWRRTRQWMVVLPVAIFAAYEQGLVVVEADVLPPRTKIVVEQQVPPKKPRGRPKLEF